LHWRRTGRAWLRHIGDRASPAAAENAPYVARGLLYRITNATEPAAVVPAYVPLLARALREPGCAGAHGLRPDEIARLDAAARK
ncbi:MAG TPA: hypothetical protein VME47_24155, partial [Acetobacteraceae bacterium]|nr:hypothetical protein [Acetobacteraceae bacterium]